LWFQDEGFPWRKAVPSPARAPHGKDTVASLHARLARVEREAAELRELTTRQRDRTQELRRSYRATVLALAEVVEARDAHTHSHAQRVAAYGLRIAYAAGVEVDAEVEFGFVLHDVGKVAVPDAILFKPGPLTADELALVRRHPVIGAEILRHVDFLDEARSVVRHHHERWDGTGYPDRLAGAAIPAHARLFAVADTLDAVTSERPYRAAASFERAREIIRGQSGTQFDPAMVAAYESVSDEAFARIRDAITSRPS
jgi:ribonuclease P protein subunit RPR2